MSNFFQLLFRLTAFSIPVFALGFIYQDYFWKCMLFGVFLSILSLLIVFIIKKTASKSTLKIDNFENIDDQCSWITSGFLLAMLSLKPTEINLNILAMTGVVSLLIFCSNKNIVLHPILRIFGWHFYKVNIREGASYTLLSKRIIRNNSLNFEVIKLNEYAYIEK